MEGEEKGDLLRGLLLVEEASSSDVEVLRLVSSLLFIASARGPAIFTWRICAFI